MWCLLTRERLATFDTGHVGSWLVVGRDDARAKIHGRGLGPLAPRWYTARVPAAREGTSSPSHARCRAALAAILIVAAALRICAALTLGARTQLHGDEWQYVSAAYSIVCGDGYPGTFRPPLYPALLALGFATGGDSLLAAALLQMVLGVAVVAATYAIVRRRFGCGAALVSAGLVAVNPTLVSYAVFFWAETACALVLVLLVLALERFDQTRDRRWLLVAGAVLGAGALVREALLYVLPVVLVWLVAGREPARRQLRQLVLLLLPIVAIVGCWSARNVFLHDRLVMISTARWAPIAAGLLPYADFGRPRADVVEDFRRELFAQTDDVAREQFARGVALEAWRRIGPAQLLRKLWDGPLQLLSIDTQTMRFVRERWFPPELQEGAQRLAQLEAAYYVLLTPLGLLALWLVPGGRTKLLVVGILLLFLAMHAIAFSTNRYRVPLLPLLTLYVGPLVSTTRLRRARWRQAGGALTVALFLVIAVQSFAIPGVRRVLLGASHAHPETTRTQRLQTRAARLAARSRARSQELGCAAHERRKAAGQAADEAVDVDDLE